MRFLYTILLYLFLPFIFIRLWWRSRRLPAYAKRWSERLGFYPLSFPACLWVHAVSVGEVVAAIPLITELKSLYPHLPLLVTTTTPTGANRLNQAFGEFIHHVYLPYDVPFAISRFLNAMNPIAGFIIETELWPNLIAISKKKHIPLVLLNARLSEKSAAGYKRIHSLTKEMLSSFHFIAAQGQQDALRFIALGAPQEKVIVTGNIKFDVSVSVELQQSAKALRMQLGASRFVWIAASTHAQEEEIVLAAHKKLQEKMPGALLILVPRHPDRFEEVAKLCAQSTQFSRRSENTSSSSIDVYLGDTLGELMLLYGASDVAFIGGSLIERGGHNILEPALWAKPLLTGPHWFNFAEINPLFLQVGALTEVRHAGELAQVLIELAQDNEKRKNLGQIAQQVVTANRGAKAKQVVLVQALLAANKLCKVR